MKLSPTTLPGVVLIEPDVFSDERGRFVETFHKDRYLRAGVGTGLEFVQDNFSSSIKGTLRGLHYQLHHPQGKLVWVTRGEIFDVAVDIRRGSPTFGRWVGTMLTSTAFRQLWIPPGFAHGFHVMSAEADVAYKATAAYAPADDHSIRWDDPELAITWRAVEAPTLSKRDATAPLLRDAALPIYTP